MHTYDENVNKINNGIIYRQGRRKLKAVVTLNRRRGFKILRRNSETTLNEHLLYFIFTLNFYMYITQNLIIF